MIIKNSGSGKSFGGLGAYLTHDPNADTKERVAFTYTFNLASDDVPSAINEMYLTAENAELLKQEAGVRGGGRATKNPVKHYSLNWAPTENPSQQHIIDQCGNFLKLMGWHEHQAVLIAHTDKHPHAHLMINAIHPETGLRLNESFEHRRAHAWALHYEREHGLHCEQRLKNENEREKNMPRNIWMEFKKNEQEFLRTEQQIREKAEFEELRPENRHRREWEIFKGIQRDAREQFYADGKAEFRNLRQSIYREVREEFRDRWSDYYRAEKNTVGEDRRFLPDVKAQIIVDQKAILDARKEPAFQELMATREERREELHARQREERAEFRARLATGQDNADFFHSLAGRPEATKDLRAAFRDARQEVTQSYHAEDPRVSEWAEVTQNPSLPLPGRGVADALDAGPRAAASRVGAFLNSLFFDLTTLGSAPPEPSSSEERASQFREAAENATKQEQQRNQERADEEWRDRQKALYRE